MERTKATTGRRRWRWRAVNTNDEKTRATRDSSPRIDHYDDKTTTSPQDRHQPPSVSSHVNLACDRSHKKVKRLSELQRAAAEQSRAQWFHPSRTLTFSQINQIRLDSFDLGGAEAISVWRGVYTPRQTLMASAPPKSKESRRIWFIWLKVSVLDGWNH